eukprot:scaffold12189_cov104-Isochrysis_galbana.AAC.2
MPRPLATLRRGCVTVRASLAVPSCASTVGRNSEAQLWGAEDDRAVYFSLLEPELACLGLAGNQLLVEAVGLLDDLMSGWGGWG